MTMCDSVDLMDRADARHDRLIVKLTAVRPARQDGARTAITLCAANLGADRAGLPQKLGKR